MESASFYSEGGETEKIKAITALYRETWLIKPLDEAIDEIIKTYNFYDRRVVENYKHNKESK